MSEKQSKAIIDELRTYYESCPTYSEFLQNLAEDHDCIIFDKWLFKFMTSICDFKFSDAFWKVDYARVQTDGLNIKRRKRSRSLILLYMVEVGILKGENPWILYNHRSSKVSLCVLKL